MNYSGLDLSLSGHPRVRPQAWGGLGPGRQQRLWPPAAFPVLTLVLSRRKSKQALRDYKKVQIQLENLESSVRDRCKKEFTGEAAEGAPPAPKPAPLACAGRPHLPSSPQQTS